MSQVGSQPADAGQSADPTLAAPPRVDENGNVAGSSAGHANEELADGQTGDASAQPGEPHSPPPPPPPSEKPQNLARSSKRSLTNLRRRDRSTASKRSAQQQNEMNEKDSRLASSGRTEDNGQSRPKKRSGLMAILCCSSSDDAGQDESAQPAKVPARPTPARVSQPAQQTRQQQQNAAPSDPSAEESKEAVTDEKAGQPIHPSGAALIPPVPVHDPNKPPQGDATVDKPVPELPADALPTQENAENRPMQDDRQQPMPEQAIPAHPYGGIIAANAQETPLNEDFQGSYIPTVPIARAEEEMIHDRTPEQAARDHDIEMSDAGPSLPLTGQDAAVVVEEEKLAHEKRESMAIAQGDLPPPPPLQDRSEPMAHDGLATGPSTEASAVSTPEPAQKWLLPPVKPEFRGKKCLVLDLDETLVHSSFKILHQADFTIPVEIEGQYHNVYVIKRPGVDAFMKRVGELYEIVVFTASVSKYGDPVLDNLDIHHVVHHRLFRESCYNHQGNYVKDLSQIGRNLRETIIIDNSPTSYIFHPQHAVPVSSWFSDAHDNELLDLIPVLEDLAGSQVADVSLVLDVAL